MNNRFAQFQKQAVSAVAALTLSAIFIGAAVGPAVNAPNAGYAAAAATRAA